MEFLRTPDNRFQHLPDFPYAPHYVELTDGLRMHYLKEGSDDGPLVLLLHGEPSWCFLYRKMIKGLLDSGCRIIAPDLIGFGRSDKPTLTSDYTYARHLSWLGELLIRLDLQNINLFCQDWGGLLGLRLAIEMPDRFDRIIASNTILPTGDIPPNEAFEKWKSFSQNVPEFPVGKILDKSTVTPLSEEVIAGYEAPFPDESYKAGARIFPALVPVSPDDPEAAPNRNAWEKLAQWEKPFLTLFADSDPIMTGMEKVFQNIIPGAKEQPHQIITDAGHFIQEDKGAELAEAVSAFINAPQ